MAAITDTTETPNRRRREAKRASPAPHGQTIISRSRNIDSTDSKFPEHFTSIARNALMPILRSPDGVSWLEPKHIDIRDIAKLTIIQAQQTHALTGVEYREIVKEFDAVYRGKHGIVPSNEMVNSVVNLRLAGDALCFPPYGTGPELAKINDLLNNASPDMGQIQAVIFSIVMHPRMRSLQLVGRFMKMPPFDEFAYLIDAAALAFFRGNTPAAFMTITPVIEGVLLRWQGFPGTIPDKPGFSKSVKFVEDVSIRQHFPRLPAFFDSWTATATKILRDHIFLPTTKGSSADDFNRHLAAHLLEDKKFATRENVTRAFLLLDLLSELYMHEKRLPDPRTSTTHSEENAHTQAYIAALQSQDLPGHPENVLAQYHAKCQ